MSGQLSVAQRTPVHIREAGPEDAEVMLAYVKALLQEPGLDIPLTLEEFSYTVEQERDLLAQIAEADNSVWLVAEADGVLIGELRLMGSQRKACRHEAVLGISVHRSWRNRGVGSILMTRALTWARASGVLSRIDLQVYARNARAIHLYQKSGFQVEGRRRQAIYQDGEYVDDLVMGLLL